jgi:hypothetical protein
LGFLDALLGGRRKLSGPAPDRLFAMSTAYVQLETGLGINSRGSAGLVFQPLGTAEFESLMKDTEELLASASQETGTTTETKVDEYGYRWAMLRDPELESGGYGDRLLCAVFAFEEKGKPLYWIYNYKRGTFYPFVPAGKQKRDTEREFRLKAQMSDELPLEQEVGRDLPLWDIPI